MCCPNCFFDDFLKDFINRNAENIGACVHCESVDVALITPARLAPYFESVLDGYSPKVNGRHLWDLWAEDWGMFSPIASCQKIIEDVLGQLGQVTYSARESMGAPSSEVWAELRSELQDKNRFFPSNAPDKETFRVLIDNLVKTEGAESFFRARLMKSSDAYALGQMGAAPAEITTDGRANPAGIRYLYLADDVQTAIAEVKPSKGALVSVAEFRLVPGKEIKLIDLTNPRVTISPFRVSGVAEVRASMSFLEALGEDLSVPTQPHRATRDYLASQYLCELIKLCGYDGVIYRSSLSNGRNFAFFDPLICAPEGQVSVYRVTDVEVSAEPHGV